MEVTLTREILFLPIEHNIHIIFSPPCNILQILKRDIRYKIRDCNISSLKFFTDLRYICLFLNLTIRVDEIYLPFYVFYIMNQSCKIKANVVFPQLHTFIVSSFSLSRTTFLTYEDLIRRSWVRFPLRSKDFFFTSCGSLIPVTRANAQWVIHGFN